jgi:adenine-specific DNA-methyltransferase
MVRSQGSQTDALDLLRLVASNAQGMLRVRLEASGSLDELSAQPDAKFLGGEPTDPDLVARRSVYNLLLKTLLIALVSRRKHTPIVHADSMDQFLQAAAEFAESTQLDALRPNPLDELLVHASLDGDLLQQLSDVMASVVEAEHDLVGTLYQELLDSGERRPLGQFYTPPDVARFMASWVIRSATDRVLDPGTGSGTFLVAALNRLRELGADPRDAMGQLHGIDLDPLGTLMATLNVLLAGTGTHANIATGDFLLGAPPFGGYFDGVICNPPYSRHHALPASYKRHVAGVLQDLSGVRISRLSSLYVHFFIRAAYTLRKGGRMAFITPHEFLDVRYGNPLKQFLARHFDLKAIIVFPVNALVFPGVMTTSCITLAEKGRTAGNQVRFIKATETTVTKDLYDAVGAITGKLDGLLANVVPQTELNAAERWTPHLRGPAKRPISEALVPLRELATAHRGIATGANEFFILSRDDVERWGIEREFLTPAVNSAKALKHCDLTWDDIRRLDSERKRLWLLYWPHAAAIPADRQVWNYIRHGEQQDIKQRYLCSHRSPWYSTEVRKPAPIIFTYMSRKHPRFVYDRVGVQAVNVFHLIYPTPEAAPDEDSLKALLAFLNSSLGKELLQQEARVYGGGLVKAEPRELLSLPVLDTRRLTPDAKTALAALFEKLCDAQRSRADLDAAQAAMDRAIRDLLREPGR